MAEDTPGLLLGKQVAVTEHYSPDLLFPISRQASRSRIGIDESLPFHGFDLWHAYELSWLETGGKPRVACGRIRIPASSPNLVESKSLKLYLHSLNNHRLPSPEAFRQTVIEDVSAVVGAPVEFELLAATDPLMAGCKLPGQCIDDEPIDEVPAAPDASQLQSTGQAEEQQVYTHLLRSLCPVTGQPDWATVWLAYRGEGIERASLLRYLLGFRQHQDFHEQCVERIYCDILNTCAPESLTVQALYTRRGGLDICPLRSTEEDASHLGRMDRQ